MLQLLCKLFHSLQKSLLFRRQFPMHNLQLLAELYLLNQLNCMLLIQGFRNLQMRFLQLLKLLLES